jgi:L-fuculose-phosphate aldolase
MTSEYVARQQVVEICKRIYELGLVAANEGNVSVRLGADRILCTPAGLSKGFLACDQLVITDLSGKKLEGKERATSELRLHLAAYRARPDVLAVTHAHPPYATAFAVAGINLAQCVLPEVVVTLGRVVLAPYGTPGTEELPKTVEADLASSDAFLLSNHGVVTLGRTLTEAFFRLETVEHYAQILHLARQLGSIQRLTTEQVDKLNMQRKGLGLPLQRECVDCGYCKLPK